MPYDHAKARAEFEALPGWAKALVRCAEKSSGYGSGSGPTRDHTAGLTFRNPKDVTACLQALADLHEFASDLSAPDPSVYVGMSAPERTAVNIVEMTADGDDDGSGGGSAFDQPCRFGHRVGEHAVYCHNNLWPGAPGKCRRTWYTGGKVLDEDCPGYAPNPARGG